MDQNSTKRPPETSGGGDSPGPRRKKPRGDVREVAELTLALAALAEMRREKGPTGVEREMMAEARGKLAGLCAGFLPKEVFPVEGFGEIMEDLGLDKLKEKMGLVGFRPPAKLSIAEKVVYTKQKFEKAEANALRSAMQAESHGAAHTTNMFPLDREKNLPLSSGVVHSVLPIGHASAANSTSLPYQLPASEVRKTMASSGLPNPHRLDQRPNGSTYIPQMQANIPGNYVQPAWSQHTQSASLAKPGVHNKVSPQNLVKFQGTTKVEGTNHMASRMGSQAAGPRPFIIQNTSGNQPNMNQHMRKTNVQTSLPSNTHSEISKVVQKFLQSHLPKRPIWIPPSRDYMNKSVTCQVCKLAIVEVENVLVCDACENGYHMKCLQTQDLKTIPRGDWHCFKCLALTDGKPLPPKYGRVTRNTTTQRAVPSFPDKKEEISSDQVNQQKLKANGSSSINNSPASSMVNTNDSAPKSDAPNARGMQGIDILLCRHNKNEKSHPGSCQNEHVLKVVATPSNSSVETSQEQKLGSEIQRLTPAKPSESVTMVLNRVPSCNGQDNDLKVSPCDDGIPSKQCSENHIVVENLEIYDISKSRDVKSSVDAKQEKEGVEHSKLIENADNGVGNHARPSSDGSVVDWIGDAAQVADEKTYFSSCCINGSVYNVQDHAIFLCNKKPMPSKIQTMWEDNKTKLKWFLVNRCYFPGDLPEEVGHPCSSEGNEVYESNHGCTTLASLIQGPCEVLPPEKFIQESGRRSRLGSEENVGLRPLFQCKWFYDELKGSFRDFSSLLQPDIVLETLFPF